MKQNHVTWHTVESAALAHSTNDTATAVARLARLTEDNATPALGHQIEPSGVMPFEVARNDGIGYSCMNIAALFYRRDHWPQPQDDARPLHIH